MIFHNISKVFIFSLSLCLEKERHEGKQARENTNMMIWLRVNVGPQKSSGLDEGSQSPSRVRLPQGRALRIVWPAENGAWLKWFKSLISAEIAPRMPGATGAKGDNKQNGLAIHPLLSSPITELNGQAFLSSVYTFLGPSMGGWAY